MRAAVNENEMNTVLAPRPMSNFVETDYIRDITERGLTYLKAGFPVHFRGPAGTGKTTVAMHLAGRIGRPVVVIHGDSEYKTSDLIGSEQGYKFRRLNDNFIHSVHKYEEDMTKQWVNNRLSIAIKKGFTLVYDEFTRSRPEANNILLPILQEKMLSTSASNEEDYYMKVHPEFRAIFTSNPEEYAGVNRTQDALRDRMVTMDLDYFDYETELRVTHAKSGLPLEDSERIVRVVRGLRESGRTEFDPTVRGSIMIARTLSVMEARPEKTNGAVRRVFQDILTSETSRVGSKTNQEKVRAIVSDLIEAHL